MYYNKSNEIQTMDENLNIESVITEIVIKNRFIFETSGKGDR